MRQSVVGSLLLNLVICATARGQIIVPNAGASRQVTIFAIQALPGDPTVDPKLKVIAPQLRRFMPNHGFRLIDVQSRAVQPSQFVGCKINPELGAKAELTNALGPDGKIQFRFSMVSPMGTLVSTVISTPPNQLFLCDKVLDDGTKILVGIGAR